MSGGKDLVIGAAGCVGAAVAEALRDAGRDVRALDLVRTDVGGVEVITGDMGDPALLARALAGVTTVHQCAALVSLHPERRAQLWEVNVDKNRVVLAEARRAGVGAFVYASTQILCCRPGERLDGIDEGVAYSDRPVSAFAASRIQSERDVLAADDPARGLRTVALRVPTTWGPRDRYHLPTHLLFADRALVMRVGDGRHCSQVYAENVAYAHVLAGEALRAGKIGGRAYYLSDETPPPAYWDTMSALLAACGRKPPRARVPREVFAPVVAGFEAVWQRFGRYLPVEPWISYEALAVAAGDCWFKDDAIRRDLGWKPRVGRAEAIARTAAWFVEHPVARAWP
jgi:nucleoside-diphosphate-sugar epimerase